MLKNLNFICQKAIDDVQITRGYCSIVPTLALPQIISPEIVNCDFEKDYCNWKNETKATQFNWALDQSCNKI